MYFPFSQNFWSEISETVGVKWKSFFARYICKHAISLVDQKMYLIAQQWHKKAANGSGNSVQMEWQFLVISTPTDWNRKKVDTSKGCLFVP